MKSCPTCERELDRSDFHRDSRAKDGLQRECKSCQKRRLYDWRKHNPEAVNRIQKRYNRNNREKRIIYQQKYYRLNAERLKSNQRKYHQELKDAAYRHYGGYQCTCCGETEPQFLCLDHINGGGRKHFESIGGAARLLFWLKEQDYPDDLLQVLCHNCNASRRFNDGVCIHMMLAVHGIEVEDI